MNHFKTYCLLCCFALLTLKARVQENAFKWFTESDGLPTEWIDDIDQDDLGNIVIGTYVGLAFFDGKNFTTKTYKNGLPETPVNYLKKDPYGRLWFICYSGKLGYLSGGKIYNINSFNQKDYTNTYFFNLYFKSKKEFFINFYMPNLQFNYELKGSKWIKKEKEKSRPNYFVVVNPQNPNEIIARINASDYSKTQQKLDFVFEEPYSKKHTVLIEKGNSRFSFLTTSTRNFFSLNKILYEFGTGKIVKQRTFKKQIIGIYEGIKNTLWISFIDGGVLQIDRHDFQNKSELMLPSIQTNSFLQDRQGGLWFCTDKGLAYMQPSNFKKKMIGESVKSSVNRIFKCNDTLFIGHINGNVGYIVPGKIEQEKLVYTSPHMGTSFEGSVRDFELDENGDILFCTKFAGVYRMNRKNFSVKQICFGKTNSMIKTKQGIYVTFNREGLIKITRKGAEFVPISTKKHKIPFVEDVFESKPGHFLIGALDGLWGLHNGELNYLGKNATLRSRIYSFYRLNENYIAVGTSGRGVLIFSSKDTIQIDTDKGLVNDLVNDMLLDREGRLWVTTTNGISIISFERKNHFDRFKINNIEGSQCLNLDNFYLAEIGKSMFVSSNDGILQINKSDLNKKINYNPLNILQVKLNSKEMPLQRIRFSYAETNQLEINFRTNRFHIPNQLTYYYRLKNQNEVWNMTKSENVSFNSLAPGTYVFEVFSQELDSTGKSDTKQLEITVLHRFWQKPWFLICIVLLLIALINSLFYIYVRRKTRKLENEKLILNLQQQALNGKLNPHFIFNALNSIQNFILTKDEKAAHYYLGKFSNLIRVILDNSSLEFITIESEIKNLSLYLEIEQMRLSNSFEFQVEGDPKLKIEFETIPNMILQPFVENSILHGLAPLKVRKGFLSIQFAIELNSIRITIEDNGIGRAAAYQNKLKKEKFYESMGVSLAKEKISVYAILQKRNAQFSVEDLGTKEQPLGTKVIIVIPRRNAR